MTGSLFVTAVVVFAGATVDDLVILMALFVARRADGRPACRVDRHRPVRGVRGDSRVALLAAAGRRIVLSRWIGLFGLVPIGLGV